MEKHGTLWFPVPRVFKVGRKTPERTWRGGKGNILRVFSKNTVKKCRGMVEVLAEKKDDDIRLRSSGELISLQSTFHVSRCSALRIMKLGYDVSMRNLSSVSIAEVGAGCRGHWR